MRTRLKLEFKMMKVLDVDRRFNLGESESKFQFEKEEMNENREGSIRWSWSMGIELRLEGGE